MCEESSGCEGIVQGIGELDVGARVTGVEAAAGRWKVS